jgi:hypothetical protein
MIRALRQHFARRRLARKRLLGDCSLFADVSVEHCGPPTREAAA